jgi:hypothetical protein
VATLVLKVKVKLYLCLTKHNAMKTYILCLTKHDDIKTYDEWR